MKHKHKARIARKLIGGKLSKKIGLFDGEGKLIVGRSVRTPIFNNPIWNSRRNAIAGRVKRQQERAHQRAVARKTGKK